MRFGQLSCFQPLGTKISERQSAHPTGDTHGRHTNLTILSYFIKKSKIHKAEHKLHKNYHGKLDT